MCLFCLISLFLSFMQRITSEHRDTLVALLTFLAWLKLPRILTGSWLTGSALVGQPGWSLSLNSKWIQTIPCRALWLTSHEQKGFDEWEWDEWNLWCETFAEVVFWCSLKIQSLYKRLLLFTTAALTAFGDGLYSSVGFKRKVVIFQGGWMA